MDKNFPATPDDYQENARFIVYGYVLNLLEKTEDPVDFVPEDVYVVMFSYVLGNWKALISTMLPDGMYYEVTHNKTAEVTYIDAYKKVDNVCILGKDLDDVVMEWHD